MKLFTWPEPAHSPNVTGTHVPLNERDAQYLGALQRHWRSNRSFASMPWLKQVLGQSSVAGVFGILGSLTAAGYLELVEGRIAPAARFFERPVLAAACSWVPLFAGQGHHGLLNLDDYLIDDPARAALHRVEGDHLSDVGILSGDIVVVELHASAQLGDIVLAVVDGFPTVKKWHRSDGGGNFPKQVRPAESPPVYEMTQEVLGVVIGLARRIRGPTPRVTPAADGKAES